MSCKRCLNFFLLLATCLYLTAGVALAAAPSQSAEDELAAIQAELDASIAAQADPIFPAYAGGLGLVLLLAFGFITSRRQQEQEDAGYDPIQENRRIGDPYSRLAGTEKRRNRMF